MTGKLFMVLVVWYFLGAVCLTLLDGLVWLGEMIFKTLKRVKKGRGNG